MTGLPHGVKPLHRAPQNAVAVRQLLIVRISTALLALFLAATFVISVYQEITDPTGSAGARLLLTALGLAVLLYLTWRIWRVQLIIDDDGVRSRAIGNVGDIAWSDLRAVRIPFPSVLVLEAPDGITRNGKTLRRERLQMKTTGLVRHPVELRDYLAGRARENGQDVLAD